MPAVRGRASRQNDAFERTAPRVLAPPWTNGADVLGTSMPVEFSSTAPPEGAPSDASPIYFEQECHPLRRTKQSRRKPENHIPRPPNAFILFRSSFIKSRHVSSEVETNHSTLSKIIGLTWQNLPEAERQKWHVEAKNAQEEHRRQYPQYSFRPVHSKTRGTVAEKKKLREVGPKDQKRCAKIAELLVGGKKGQELEVAIQEFDKHHVPEIVTRFETPMTANTYSSSKNERHSRSISPLSMRNESPVRSLRRASKVKPASSPLASLEITLPQDMPHSMPPIHSPVPHSFDPFDQTPSFDLPSFNFTITQPSPSPFMEDHFTRNANIPPLHAFESQVLQNATSLCPTAQYPSSIDDPWTRQGSPLSNPTSSMPSTPAQICVPFPDSYGPSAFHGNDAATGDYQAMGNAYGDFSQFPSFAPISAPGYGGGAKDSEHLPSDLDSGCFHVHAEGIDSAQLQAHQDQEFLSFMQMATLPANYSL
ncbi:hypothetical protein BJ912DRAFT_1003448 [Pholiota molesta]|nr:hypothetical protein BJ912DRAFT_1003448 [Pholiota molesta]